VPRYVIERDVEGVGDLTREQLREISLKSLETLGSMGPKIQWLHSWVTDHKVYCVYIAPDEETLKVHAEKTGIPASRISRVRGLLDPANYT
jgi:hypothetical protein